MPTGELTPNYQALSINQVILFGLEEKGLEIDRVPAFIRIR
jgi:hypothetical protein